MIDGFRADAGYILVFDGDLLISIAKSRNIEYNYSIISENNVPFVINEEDFEIDGYSILEQTTEDRINMYTKEAYTLVTTFYENEKTGDVFSVSDKYNENLFNVIVE